MLSAQLDGDDDDNNEFSAQNNEKLNRTGAEKARWKNVRYD